MEIFDLLVFQAILKLLLTIGIFSIMFSLINNAKEDLKATSKFSAILDEVIKGVIFMGIYAFLIVLPPSQYLSMISDFAGICWKFIVEIWNYAKTSVFKV